MSITLDENPFEKSRILVIGDIMLDRYLWGNVSRISPEAPIPVFRIQRRSEVLGGCGNVVSNLAGLGCQVSVIGLLGKDEAGIRLKQLLDNGRTQDLTIERTDQPTITKTRVVANNQQLIRLDEEENKVLDGRLSKKVVQGVQDTLEALDAVILSDYGKGLLQTKDLSKQIIAMAQSQGIPVFVDPKGRDWERYKGADCITPNTKELELLRSENLTDNDKLLVAMKETLDAYDLSWLLVTRGPLGMILMNREGQSTHISAQARQVFDVSGAGDTVISTLAAAVGSKFAFPDAARLANLAAGIVVGKLGTQPINLLELRASVHMDGTMLSGSYLSKVLSRGAASLQVEAWKAGGGKIVFTNGCFDLLHPGHIHLLNQAKALGHRLVVGLNSDDSVKRLKGPGRPILREQDRASILGSLDSVDLVVIFEEDTPKDLIRVLQPEILVKGADYGLSEVVGRDIVESYGGTVRLVNVLEGYSTTEITRKVLADRAGGKE